MSTCIGGFKSRFCFRSAVAGILSVFVWAATIGANPVWADFSLTYLGRTYDSDAQTTTFSYQLSQNGGQDLSHFVVGFPLACKEDLKLLVISGSPAGYVIGQDPPTGLWGIKWNTPGGLSPNPTTFSFTFEGNVKEGDVQAATKAGQTNQYFDTKGPSCDTCVLNEGESCSEGVGICEDEGTIQCDGSCGAEPGEPNPLGELCDNGQDDDCDGEIDEVPCDSDCNENGLPDLCDVAPEENPQVCSNLCAGDDCGLSEDCDDNNTPDECQNDEDGDGFIDDCEDCDLDPLKQAPGACGCGNPDTDTDGDGTADCADLCPEDEGKVAPGVCGCGVPDVDENNNGVIDCEDNQNNECPPGEECIYEDLEPSACAGANGFLYQVNIASVQNLKAVPLKVRVEYRDLAGGAPKGIANATIGPNLKQDFIVNDLGLELDRYGTVCVITDATERGAWSGGVAIYKPDLRSGTPAPFGTSFDFVLYHPFTNPRKGAYTQPLNTFHLGVDPVSTVANWVSITDGEPGDGKLLFGKLVYLDQDGNTAGEQEIFIPDGGRFDFSGHEGIGGPDNNDAVGMVQFHPKAKEDGTAATYYIVIARYFYECVGASCPNFHTAFVVPHRPAATVALNGGVSTVKGELSIVELNNLVGSDNIDVGLNFFDTAGVNAGAANVPIPPQGTRHYIVNKVGDQGVFAADSVGAAQVAALNGSVSAVSMFYKLDAFGKLLYAYATPLLEEPGVAQVSEYNSFLGQRNEGEVFNPNDDPVSVNIRAIDYLNTQVAEVNLDIPAKGSERFDFALPPDSYGSIIIQANGTQGVVFRNYVSRADEYAIAFRGR